MRWLAVKKTPLLVKYLGCHCDCDVRRFMLWFNTHEWKRSVNGMRPALTAESAGRKISTGDSEPNLGHFSSIRN